MSSVNFTFCTHDKTGGGGGGGDSLDFRYIPLPSIFFSFNKVASFLSCNTAQNDFLILPFHSPPASHWPCFAQLFLLFLYPAPTPPGGSLTFRNLIPGSLFPRPSSVSLASDRTFLRPDDWDKEIPWERGCDVPLTDCHLILDWYLTYFFTG